MERDQGKLRREFLTRTGQRKVFRLFILTVWMVSLIGVSAVYHPAAAERPTPGSIVTFGRYKQDADAAGSLEEIEWIVLDYDAEQHKALLLSRYGLVAGSYNTEHKSTTWEKCALRVWLNDTFYQTAFSAEEQAMILATSADNGPSQGYGAWKTSGGNDTRDPVFLLSYTEANRYLGVSPDDRGNTKARTAPTAWAAERGAWTSPGYKTADDLAAGWWWLRSPGHIQSYVAIVSSTGSLNNRNAILDYGLIRPAVWISIE